MRFNTNIKVSKKYTDFDNFMRDCKIINLELEYPNHVGEEKYVILTSVEQHELEKRYKKILTFYEPYVISSIELYEAFEEYNRNEDKYEKRNARNTISLDEIVNDESESRFGKDEVLIEIIKKAHDERIKVSIDSALKEMGAKTRRRFVMWAVHRIPQDRIAMTEGVRQQTVQCSVSKAKERILACLEEVLPYSHPLFNGKTVDVQTLY